MDIVVCIRVCGQLLLVDIIIVVCIRVCGLLLVDIIIVVWYVFVAGLLLVDSIMCTSSFMLRSTIIHHASLE